MLVPINLTGGTYRHRSLPVSAQTTRNFWPQKQDVESAKSPYILAGFPGLKLFGTSAAGPDRGMLEHKGQLYKVSGTSLYQVTSGGTHTLLGAIAGSSRCSMQGMGDNVVVVGSGRVYVWDGATLTEATDPDLETPNFCAHLNNQMIYDGDGGRWCVSDVGDPATINALNYATAEASADDLLRPYVFDNTLYLFGEKSIEQWFNSGEGHPPFERIQGMTHDVGLGAAHSVANDESGVYFLGHDSQAYAVSGKALKAISSSAMTSVFSSYSRISDAIGWTARLDGHPMYFLTFPSADKTWAYAIGGDWFEWSYGSSGGRALANSCAFAFRKNLVADWRNGNIYELDPETFTDNGDAIVRVRDTAPIHGGLVDRPGRSLEMNRFELIMETGVGLTSGQGEEPRVMLSVSDDGGRSFSTEMWGTAGRKGAFQWKVEWFALGRFEERVVRIRMSDPVRCVICHAAADVEVCL